MSRGIPPIRQMEDADCGAACLAMVLGYFGKRADLRELRDATGAGRDGVTALSIVNAARAYGLRARGVKADTGDLRRDPGGRPGARAAGRAGERPAPRVHRRRHHL